MAASSAKLKRIQNVLAASKNVQLARLKAKLAEIETARRTAADLRAASMAQPPVTTVAEMQHQSKSQQIDEHRARRLEAEAMEMMSDVQEMRAALAQTLGREQAAESLVKSAERAEQTLRERRAETVPGQRRPT